MFVGLDDCQDVSVPLSATASDIGQTEGSLYHVNLWFILVVKQHGASHKNTLHAARYASQDVKSLFLSKNLANHWVRAQL